jgi:hypothetical protein
LSFYKLQVGILDLAWIRRLDSDTRILRFDGGAERDGVAYEGIISRGKRDIRGDVCGDFAEAYHVVVLIHIIDIIVECKAS